MLHTAHMPAPTATAASAAAAVTVAAAAANAVPLPHARLHLQMPEQLGYDPDVMALRGAVREVQAEFVEAHKALGAARGDVK